MGGRVADGRAVIPPPGLRVRHDDGSAVTVTDGEVELLRYVYVPDDAQLESPRPYFHPVRTRAGDLVSLYRPDDHVWHKGISWSLPNVGDHNFWGGPTYVVDDGYVQLGNNGSMDHVRFTGLSSDGLSAGFTHELVWHAQPAPGQRVGDEVVHETRAVGVVVPAEDVWVLTFVTTMTNASGRRLDIGSPTTRGRDNAGYGGLFWRGPQSFVGGTILAPGTAGGEELRGVRAAWAGFAGRHEGTGTASTLVIVDDPANPVHPPAWFVRNEWFAALCPAPFFSSELAFLPNSDVTFRYAVVVADGGADPVRGEELADLGRAALAERHRVAGVAGSDPRPDLDLPGGAP